jgi:hypothetical protein
MTMKSFQLSLLSLLVFISSCEKIEDDVPDCLRDEIRSFSRTSFLCDKGATVEEFLFQGEFVYVFNPGNCGADMGADVIDESCNNIGFLGGIAGNMIINGVVFHQEAVFQRIVWEN